MATATADIKKFTGYIAPDNTTHKTAKEAIAYARDLKVKEALLTFAGTALDALFKEGADRHEGLASAGESELADFLFKNQAAITAAFNQEVRVRAQRTKKQPVTVKASVPPAVAAAVA